MPYTNPRANVVARVPPSPVMRLARPGVVGPASVAAMGLARTIYNMAVQASSDPSKKRKLNKGSQSRSITRHTGGSGTYQGKLKRKVKPKKLKVKGFHNGQTIKREGRGTLSDAEAVYVGVGAPGALIVEAFIACIVRELLTQSGAVLESWGQPFVDMIGGSGNYPASSLYTISYQWFASVTSANELSATYSIPTGDSTSIQDIIDGLSSAIRTTFSTSTYHQFTKFSFFGRVSNGTTTVSNPLSSVDVGRMKLHVKCFQNMLIQNRTKAGIQADDAADADDKDNIFANPLYCVNYQTKGNGFTPRYKAETGNGVFYPGTTHGTILGVSTGLSEGKQPNSLTFKGTKSVRDIIEPGAIKKLVNVSDEVMSVKKFCSVFRLFFDTNGTIDYIPYGNAAMIGIEKMLSITASEWPILVGYEHNQTITVNYKYSPRSVVGPLLITTASV